MKVDGQYSHINSAHRTQNNNRVHDKSCSAKNKNEKPKTDTYARSTEEDANYMKHMAAYNQYMAVLASSAIRTPKNITPIEELETEPQPEFPSPVEKSGNSNPTHNNETHHYNQDENPQNGEECECFQVETED